MSDNQTHPIEDANILRIIPPIMTFPDDTVIDLEETPLTIHPQYPSAKAVIDQCKHQWLAHKGHRIVIDWTWAGKHRVGVVKFLIGKLVVARVSYPRRSASWTAKDADYRSIHVGSAKYDAVREALLLSTSATSQAFGPGTRSLTLAGRPLSLRQLMATYQELLAQKQALEAQIAAAHKAESSEAVARVRAIVAEYGLTDADVFGRGGAKAEGRKGGVVAPKYKDPATGATWSGRGKPPLWIAGKDREQFAIQ